MQQHNIADTVVYELSLPTSILPALKQTAVAEYDSAWSKSQDSFLGVYLFKTPPTLVNPPSGPGYQYLVQQTSEVVQTIELIKSALHTITSAQYRVSDIWYLLQTNESWIANPIHQHLTAEWVACVYINVNPGDSIEFFDSLGAPTAFAPTAGTVLIFPASALHRPAPNAGVEYRISLNMEFSST